MNQLCIQQKILNVYKECGIRSFPIDCFSILEQYGFRIFNYEAIRRINPELHAICLKFTLDAFSDPESRMILYNQDNSWCAYGFHSCMSWAIIFLPTTVITTYAKQKRTIFPAIFWHRELRSIMRDAQYWQSLL